mgnify:CR=1 FL=1
MSAALCVGAATHLTLMPGCATVANDPVGTNAARYVQTANIARSSYIAWASVLEADVHRVTPIITPEKRESVKQIRIEIDTLLGEWNRSVSAGEAFSGIDSLFSLLDALARLTTEAAR